MGLHLHGELDLVEQTAEHVHHDHLQDGECPMLCCKSDPIFGDDCVLRLQVIRQLSKRGMEVGEVGHFSDDGMEMVYLGLSAVSLDSMIIPDSFSSPILPVPS